MREPLRPTPSSQTSPASATADGAPRAGPPGSSLCVSILGGPVGFQADYGYDFQREVIAALEDLGYLDETTTTVEAAFPALPKFPVDFGPIAAIGAEDLLIGFGVYTAAKLSDAVISEMASRIYQHTVGVALERLWAKVPRKVSNRQRPFALTATFEHYFDASHVLVRVIVETDTTAAGPSARHVPAALRHGLGYVEEHGGHVVLTYRVTDDELDEHPSVRPLP